MAHQKKFSISKGVKQSNPLSLSLSIHPLSPYLFIISMEGLNVAMKTACAKGILKGLKMPHNKTMISHLFYEDDTLFIEEC